MNRTQWLSAGVISAALTIAVARSASAQITCTVTVTGQNNVAVDAAAVQSATNQAFAGDLTVCLEGTFDFAPPVPPSQSSVNIFTSPFTTSLRIVGLDNPATGRKATIRNGRQSLTKQGANPPIFSIENLRFEQPEFSAISILGAGSASSIKISNVNIVGVRTFVFPAFNNARFREGIVVTSGVQPVGGDIEISSNVIDGGAYTADDTALGVSGGVVLTGALPPPTVNQPFTARVRVSDNRIVNWSGSGILAAGVSELTVERNVIQPGAFANTIPPGCTAANGLGSGNGISLQSVRDGTVRDNVITLVPSLTGAGATPPCTAGLILVGATNVAPGQADGTVVYRNRIRGSGTYAIVVGVTPAALPPGPIASVETDNLFALNRLANFAPQGASLFIGAGAVDNAFVGNFPSLAGNVAGNTVISRLE